MIEIKDLKIWVSEKEILKWVDLKFKIWKNYCLLWKNGSWKSSLSNFLMWNPNYKYISWEVFLDWKNLIEMSVEDRAKAGIFLSFQNVPEISGIKLWEFLRTIYNIHLKNKKSSHSKLDSESSKNDTESNSVWQLKEISPFIFKRFVKKYLEELKIEENFLDRDLNVGFSGWEKRKIEILQMKLIWPKYIILDEIDSGLDLDAFKKVCKMLKSIDSKENTFIIITHYFEILKYLDIDKVYIIQDGRVIKKWKKNLIEEIKENGYEVEN